VPLTHAAWHVLSQLRLTSCSHCVLVSMHVVARVDAAHASHKALYAATDGRRCVWHVLWAVCRITLALHTHPHAHGSNRAGTAHSCP